MNINLVSPATSTPPTKTLNLRLNRNADGVIVLEAQGEWRGGGGITVTPWTPILSFPTGREDGLLRLCRETNLPFSLGSFIDTTGGNNSILMIRTGNLD